MTNAEILSFIKTKHYAVISTCGANHKPESALIGFGETDSLELLFGTYSTSRKYKNLKENTAVSFVIGWDEDYITVQYEGIATELSSEEIERYIPLYHAKVPAAAKFKSNPHQTYWKVTPVWIRFSDFRGDEAKIYEVRF